MIGEKVFWSSVLNAILHQYLQETTICLVWHKDFDLTLEWRHNESVAAHDFIVIEMATLQASFNDNVIDFEEKRKKLKNNGLSFPNQLTEKLTNSIEISHCEGFIVFQDDIPKFIEGFALASKYSIWRSMYNKFIFAYAKTSNNREDLATYLEHKFFRDEPKIVLIENDLANASYFEIKTNKFVGPRNENPESFYLLDVYDANAATFSYGVNLFPDKTFNMHGREVILASFDYRPYVALEYGEEYTFRDIAYNDSKQGSLLMAGTEIQGFIEFCARYNCTVQINTAEADDWGTVYPNFTGYGALGMVNKGMAEVGIGAMYSWYEDYQSLEMSMYLVRSGITCVVPAPHRRASWLLPVQPFRSTLWIGVISCLCTEILSLMLAYEFEVVLWKKHEHRNSWFKSFAFAFAMTLKLFISQSSKVAAKTMALRIVLFSCFLIDIIVTSAYGGGLASILTIPSFDEAADSLERLQSHKLPWSANSEAWVLSIEASDDPRMKALLKKFTIYSDEELKQLAQNDKNMGFTIERLPFGHYAVGDHLTAEVLERMKIMIDDIYFEYTVAFTARLWPLLERYNNLICLWHSSGFDKFWEWRTVSAYLNMNLQKEVEASMFIKNRADLGPTQLDMSNFVGILTIWLIGVTMASIIFIGELLWGHRVSMYLQGEGN